MKYAYMKKTGIIRTDEIIDQFRMYGIHSMNIYIEGANHKQSTELNRLISLLSKNDLLVLNSLYDLSDDCEEISCIWHVLCKEIQVQVVVLDNRLIDTRPSDTNIDPRFVIDMVEDILRYIGKNQKAIQHIKQIKGIEEAKENGVQFGRPKKIDFKACKTVMAQYHQKRITLQEAMIELNIKKTTFYKYYNQYLKEE